MIDKEKLIKIKKLADAMYYAAQYLTTDASRLHKAMDEYHQFIIHEYFKEEPVSNSDWLTELQEKLENATPEQLEELWNKYNGVDEEEPVSEVWHDANEEQPEKYRTVVVWNPITMDGEVLTRCAEVYKGKGKIWAYIEDLLNLSNVEQAVKNWKEPVSEDIDKAAFDYMETKLDEVKDRKMFLSNFFGSDVENAFKDGAKRQKIKDSEEIKLIRGLLEDFDKHCDEYHEAGFKHGQEAMMKDATDVIVHIDAGGYPYIPQMELYDYDKDIPLAKKGDKYKVVLIKED